MPRITHNNIVQLTKKQLDKKKVEANRQLQDNNNALIKNMKALEGEAKKAQEFVENVTGLVKENKKVKKALDVSLKSLVKKHSQAESVLFDKESKLGEISQITAKLYKDLELGKKELRTINKAIEQANAVKPDIIKLKEELQSVDKDVTMKKVGLDDLAYQEGILKDRIKKIASEYEEKTKPYEKSLSKAKDKQVKLRKKHKDEVIALEKETQDVVSVITKHQGQLKSIEREIAAARSLFNDETEKIKNLTEQVKQLERDKAILMRGIADSKKSYEGWRIKEMEKVAKKVLKGRLENIDKAGLKDALNAI